MELRDVDVRTAVPVGGDLHVVRPLVLEFRRTVLMDDTAIRVAQCEGVPLEHGNKSRPGW